MEYCRTSRHFGRFAAGIWAYQPTRMYLFSFNSVEIMNRLLPARLANAWNHAFIGEFAETNATQTEIAHIAMLAATLKAAIHLARGEFRLFL